MGNKYNGDIFGGWMNALTNEISHEERVLCAGLFFPSSSSMRLWIGGFCGMVLPRGENWKKGIQKEDVAYLKVLHTIFFSYSPLLLHHYLGNWLHHAMFSKGRKIEGKWERERDAVFWWSKTPQNQH